MITKRILKLVSLKLTWKIKRNFQTTFNDSRQRELLTPSQRWRKKCSELFR